MTRSITVVRYARNYAAQEFKVIKATNVTDPHVGDYQSQGDLQNLIASDITVNIVPAKR